MFEEVKNWPCQGTSWAWVEPDGNVHELDWSDTHEDYAEQWLSTSEYWDDYQKEAEHPVGYMIRKLGWLRAGNASSFSGLGPDKISYPQRMFVLKAIQMCPEGKNTLYAYDIVVQSSGISSMKTNSLKEFIVWIKNKGIKGSSLLQFREEKEIINETNYNPDGFSWAWIEPNGVIHELNGEVHEDFARKAVQNNQEWIREFPAFATTYKPHHSIDFGVFTAFLILKKWVRAPNSRDFTGLSPEKLTRKTIGTINFCVSMSHKVISERSPANYEIYDGTSVVSKKFGDAEQFIEWVSARNSIKEAKKKIVKENKEKTKSIKLNISRKKTR